MRQIRQVQPASPRLVAARTGKNPVLSPSMLDSGPSVVHANKYHSVHAGNVCALLGDGSVRYLSTESGAKDRRRIVRVSASEGFAKPLVNKQEPVRPNGTTSTNDVKVDIVAGLTPFTPTRAFGILLTAAHVLLSIGLACLATSEGLGLGASSQLYNNYVGVALMMLVGFGYLMTFLRYYGLGAVGLTLLITVIGVEASLLLEPLFAHGIQPFAVSIMSLLEGNFAAATFLISFGALLGKVSPTQTLILVLLESVFYCINKHLILLQWLSVGAFADVGGSISIHLFGAYFGLAASRVLGPPAADHSTRAEKSSVHSDVTSLIGTTFLWLVRAAAP